MSCSESSVVYREVRGPFRAKKATLFLYASVFFFYILPHGRRARSDGPTARSALVAVGTRRVPSRCKTRLCQRSETSQRRTLVDSTSCSCSRNVVGLTVAESANKRGYPPCPTAAAGASASRVAEAPAAPPPAATRSSGQWQPPQEIRRSSRRASDFYTRSYRLRHRSQGSREPLQRTLYLF